MRLPVVRRDTGSRCASCCTIAVAGVKAGAIEAPGLPAIKHRIHQFVSKSKAYICQVD
jgi:hypothetical protein